MTIYEAEKAMREHNPKYRAIHVDMAEEGKMAILTLSRIREIAAIAQSKGIAIDPSRIMRILGNNP